MFSYSNPLNCCNCCGWLKLQHIYYGDLHYNAVLDIQHPGIILFNILIFLTVVPHIQELFFPESTVFRGTSDSHKANHVTEATGHCKWSNGVDTLASFTLPHGEKSSEFHILPCSLASFQRSIGTKASSLLPTCQYVSQSLSHPS